MNARELQESKLERSFCAAHCARDKDGEKKALEAIKAAENNRALDDFEKATN